MEVVKLESGRYAKDCPSCGGQQTYLRKNYAELSLRQGKLCKSCSNKITENCHRGWHRGVRVSWFNSFKSSAILRGIEWDLSIDDVADVMDAQRGLCALTGWSIEFPESGHPQSAPASIDRVDSSKGYTLGNIQLVTRHVNMMKQAYDNDYFIEVCRAVASNSDSKVKW